MKKLLMVGAGEYGHVVRELALQVGYEAADFLDDNSPEAIGKIDDYSRVRDEYEEFIVAIGNPTVRKRSVEMMAGKFKLATIIHPMAYVSTEANIAAGCVIEPGCVVYRNAVLGEACLVNAGAVLNHDSTVESYCQICCNAVVAARAMVPEGTKINHGVVVE